MTNLGLFVVLIAAGSAAGGTVDEPLRAKLLQAARDDQEAIRVMAANPGKPPTEAENRLDDEIHTRNGGLIRSIVREHGWPGRRLVGDDGASAAWLIVQHMDEDPGFQRACLELMKPAFDAGEVAAHDFAYLTDRVLTHEGMKQMYGTQGIGVTSPADEARVNRNRAAIGLPPWREAVEKRQKDYANGYGGTSAKP